MIDYHYDEHGITAITSGNAADIAAELGHLVTISYNLIRSKYPRLAEDFKRYVQIAMRPDSPVWDQAEVPDPYDGIKMAYIYGGMEARYDNIAE